jgi:hypothetical protein
MTQRISRERCVPKEGGFETRPYEPPDCASLRQKEAPVGFRNGRYFRRGWIPREDFTVLGLRYRRRAFQADAAFVGWAIVTGILSNWAFGPQH